VRACLCACLPASLSVPPLLSLSPSSSLLAWIVRARAERAPLVARALSFFFFLSSLLLNSTLFNVKETHPPHTAKERNISESCPYPFFLFFSSLSRSLSRAASYSTLFNCTVLGKDLATATIAHTYVIHSHPEILLSRVGPYGLSSFPPVPRIRCLVLATNIKQGLEDILRQEKVGRLIFSLGSLSTKLPIDCA